jgi:1-acyl-sn-glycerol-3-phosphate acyltransferase
LVFHDNKKRFSYTFLSGSTGRMRVTILPEVATKTFSAEDKQDIKNLREKVREQILNELNRA